MRQFRNEGADVRPGSRPAAECVTIDRAIGVWLVALVTAVLCACVTTVDNRAEEIIRNELPRLVGPAREYKVDVRGVVPSSGTLQTVRVIGERIARPGSPVIDHAELNLRDVSIDQPRKRVLSVGGADARVRVLAPDIAVYLDARPGFDAVQVLFHGSDEISVELVPSIVRLLLPAGGRVRMRGHLVPDGPRLRLEVVDLSVAGRPVGALPKIALEQLVNPIVDLSTLPAPAQVTSVRVAGDALIIEASGVSQLSARAPPRAITFINPS